MSDLPLDARKIGKGRYPNIAIDGPAASGKGTLCKRLAAYYDFDLLDTGLLYRAAAAHCAKAEIDLEDEESVGRYVESLEHIDTEQRDLRTESVGSMASKISRYPLVRAALLDYQRDFAAHPPNQKGAILDGRDIGTVICPDTPYKIFLTASAEVRAKRRFIEMQNLGKDSDFSDILADVQRRDAQDQNRAIAPLIPADDACIINTSTLDADCVFVQARDYLYTRGIEG